jgi:glucose-1-phosphate cytidylyltransferase
VKVVILAGGLGSRLAEETVAKPKPMVEVGGRPILWHIMKIYASYGFRDFIVALGYRGDYIKKYMVEYASLAGDISVSLRDGRYMNHSTDGVEDWRVQLIDTGQETETGGRLRRLKPHLGGETFMMTYGDGVSSVDVNKLVAFHRSHGKLATLTAVHPPARFGMVEIGAGDVVEQFAEHSQAREGWINGGFFVLEPGVIDYIAGDSIPFQREPLMQLAQEKELMAYEYGGFWQCMDTLRDREYLEELWSTGSAPWKVWQ